MKCNGKRILRLVIVGTFLFLINSNTMIFAEVQARIVHFPKNNSMGMLFILDTDKVDTSSDDDWRPLCEATSDVQVPAGKALRLNLGKNAGEDLSSLSELRPDDLVILSCQGVEISDEQLKYISHLSGLYEINLRESNILGTGLKYLLKLKSLKHLYLSNTHVGDNELAYLSDLPSLENLELRSTPTTDAGMVHIGEIASLEVLSLSSGVGDEGLSHLKGLANLRWLSAGNRGITDEGLAHLSGLTNMEYLNLEGVQVTDAGLIHLKNMKNLRRLRLYGTPVTEKGFVHLEGLENLEELLVLYGVTDIGLMHLSKLPSLKNITVDGESLSSKGIAMLSKMKSLEHLYIDNTNKMDEIVKELINLPGIKELTIGTGLTDKGLVQLKNMKSLQEITIGPSQITGKGIAALATLSSLKILNFTQIKLSSEDEWSSFGKLSSLQSLSLKYIRSEVTDAHIVHLTGLQDLRDLTIDAVVTDENGNLSFSMDITDKGLEYISKLKSLESLSLRGIKITDKGFKHLEKLNSLKLISLQGCDVSEDDLQPLREKLPALRWNL